MDDAFVELAAGRLDEANTAFNKAVELAPDFWNAYEGLAFARIYSGDWVGGRKALRRSGRLIVILAIPSPFS